MPKLWKRSALIFLAIAAGYWASFANAQEEDAPALQPYVPARVPPPPPGISYLLPDGSAYVLANDLIGPFLERIDAIFEKSHPNIRIKLNALGSEPGIAALTAGTSAFTPLGRDGLKQDLDGYAALYGYTPVSFLVGYDQSPDPDIFPPGKLPSAIWINSKNPLPKITLAQAEQIFLTGVPKGDITHWSQLGVRGEWGKREIHVYLPAKRDSAFLFIDRDRMGGGEWTRRAEWLEASQDVIAAVAQDPFGIGICGFWPPDAGWEREAELGDKAKLLALGENDDARFSHAGVGDIYPLTGSIRIYFPAPDAKSMEPWMKEYVRLLLSKDGQQILADMQKTDGYIPLEPQKVAVELDRLRQPN